jgi:cell division septal protein FtsQ
VIALVILIAAIVGYRMAASAALFQVQAIDVTGTSRTSADEIQGLTRRALARTGVWRADLVAISNELSRLPGVRRAVVTRVLPDRVRVRISERSPLAVVRTSAGHFVWVDDEGVMLGEMKPIDHLPPFFIRGWNEEGGDDARRENAERVQKYLQLVKELDANGLSQRVSEVTPDGSSRRAGAIGRLRFANRGAFGIGRVRQPSANGFAGAGHVQANTARLVDYLC